MLNVGDRELVAEVAQVVEHGSEKAGVGSASLPLGTTSVEAAARKLRARQLRLDGKSYNEIRHLLGVPKSTVAFWLRGLKLPLDLQERLYARARSAGTVALVARNKRQTVLARARADAVKAQAASEIGTLSRRELLLIGSALYWGEGGKVEGREITFTNSDPQAVRVMMRFFREVCRINEADFRVHVAVHAGMDAEAACRFWNEATGISRTQFTKPFVANRRVNDLTPPARRLPHGTCQVRISDIRRFHQIMGWIAGIERALDYQPDQSSQSSAVPMPA